ncbi:5'-deoxynucleotidase [Oribacterium sp. C9]|uniref:5'-deoxynucleotidase n=1 Tax=Oribacterium sp. C9 TaxID=1943579 RepID=UPI00098EB9A7|nr:5'-deoxynucleotidase [Oribacterium sp. C9]OON85665.1 5'-deoxynucleotidase [Oribacterium sp. C9]
MDKYTFFATISRMKYIERWALMRNSRPENLSEHAVEVAMIAHALCIIGNVRYGRKLDGEKAALIGIYHDASEIITGDMPTPVKYFNKEITGAYKSLEHIAENSLLERLPEDLRPAFDEIFNRSKTDENELYMRKLVKAADKISALIKCIEEENSGNREFCTAKESTLRSLEEMKENYPEVGDFLREFLPPYGSTLDELAL